MKKLLIIKLLLLLSLVISGCSYNINSPRKDPMWSNGHNKN